jgi:hypothetical protein
VRAGRQRLKGETGGRGSLTGVRVLGVWAFGGLAAACSLAFPAKTVPIFRAASPLNRVLGGPGRRVRQHVQALSRIHDYLAHATRHKRATRFAWHNFPSCASHVEEAIAVHKLVERFCGRRLRELDADASVEDVVGPTATVSLRGLDMVEVAELVAALEKEAAVTHEPELADEPPDVLAAGVLGQVLLGPAATRTRWDPVTVWRRSVRGVINERVRWRGGCTCGTWEGRPTTR